MGITISAGPPRWSTKLSGRLKVIWGVGANYSDIAVTYTVNMGRACASSNRTGLSDFYRREILEDGITLQYMLTPAGVRAVKDPLSPIVSNVLMHMLAVAQNHPGELITRNLKEAEGAMLIAQLHFLDQKICALEAG